jgi:hypothetical protein
MFIRSPRRSLSSKLLVRRLDRAATELNPILTIIIIGLVVLNLIAAASLFASPAAHRWEMTVSTG